jgi:hypothetical protein
MSPTTPIAAQIELIPECVADGDARVLEAIVRLRSQPEGPAKWRDVEFDTCLGPRVITRYVWLLAALLRAQGMRWADIAAHPWVAGKLKADVLRNKHRKARLPAGLKFGQVVEGYQRELKERVSEVLASKAGADAENVRQLVVRLLQDCDLSGRKLRAGQQNFEFDDSAELPTDQLNRELSVIHGRREITQTIDHLFRVLRLTTSSPTEINATPEQAEQQAGAASLEERIAARRAQFEPEAA